MHSGALDQAVNDIAGSAQTDPNQVEFVGRNEGDGSPVGLVMAGGEELPRVDGGGNASAHGAFPRRCQQLSPCREYDHRLAQHGKVLVAVAVAVGRSRKVRGAGSDGAHKEGRDIEFLPGQQVIPKHHHNLGVDAEGRRDRGSDGGGGVFMHNS